MFDYAAWLDRAIQSVSSTQKLKGVKIEGKVDPPLTNDRFEQLAASCRLPIPRSLRELWTKATSHSELRFHWTVPAQLIPQLRFVTDDRHKEFLCGGPEIISCEESVVLANQFIEWLEVPNYAEYPRDCRYWAHSFPLIPDGTGDFIGLYVRDEVEDPPVVYLCHEAYGGSRVVAPNLATFLEEWEKLCFVELDVVNYFMREQDSRLSVADFPIQHKALTSLFQGKVETDLIAPAVFTSEQQWENCLNADTISNWETNNGTTKLRKLRLFACACARRFWPELGKTGQYALEVCQLFADGEATQAELDSARDALNGGIISPLERPGALESFLNAMQLGAEHLMQHIDSMESSTESTRKSIDFHKSEGRMQHIGYSLINMPEWISRDITHHLDGEEFEAERLAQSNLARHIFGNPWHPVEHAEIRDKKILDLANRLHAGETVANELAHELEVAGHAELAKHFRQESDHPRGCWALDIVLGRD